MEYFCYRCNNVVPTVLVDDKPICGICCDDFVEEVPGEANNGDVPDLVEQIHVPFPHRVEARVVGVREQQARRPRRSRSAGHAVRNPPRNRMIPRPRRQNRVPPFRRVPVVPLAPPRNRNRAVRYALIGELDRFEFAALDIPIFLAELLMHLEEYEAAPHLTPDEIHRLPMTEVCQDRIDNETNCATCMDAFVLRERVAVLDCHHIFHRPCIEPWLRLHNTCPICRGELKPEKWCKPVIDIDGLD